MLVISISFAKADDISLDSYQPRYIVDMPTAGILNNLEYSVNALLVGNGGALVDFTVGLFKIVNAGISYGGTGIIGYSTMNMQKYPGFHIKVRVIGEKEALPAFVLGFNSQGKGTYVKPRYEQLSPDFYLVASKNFKWALGSFAVTGGINYSLLDPNDRGINIFAGIEQSILNICGISLEINPNFNDNNETIWKKERNSVMLNGALKFTPLDDIIIEVQFKDMLRNARSSDEVGRYFSVTFISKLL
jgi:hypothetical protein